MYFKQQAIKEITGKEYVVHNEHLDDYEVQWENDTPIDKATIDAKATELETAYNNSLKDKEDLKTSAKNKLMNGEALTEDEANVMVGL
jgi:hypothetical protein|tara:strand:+ start:503 stop:766 length:264 start_codon:yes stop_codon:yes gene_type:complete